MKMTCAVRFQIFFIFILTFHVVRPVEDEEEGHSMELERLARHEKNRPVHL
jgi:hypothetical protein